MGVGMGARWTWCLGLGSLKNGVSGVFVLTKDD